MLNQQSGMSRDQDRRQPTIEDDGLVCKQESKV